MRRSQIYTHGHHESVLRSHRWRTATNSAAYLLPHLRSGDRLLDVGAGAGTITADLAARIAPGRVTAVEITAQALDLTRAEAATRGQDNIDFEVADLHELPMPAASFDVVHAHQVLQHVADPVRALREMRRVCRPGGIVAARDGDYGTFTWFPALPELTEWRSWYRRVARSNGGEPDAGRHLLSWARSAGFTEVTATASVWCFSTEEDRAWWGESWADRTRHSDLARQLVDRCGVTLGDLDRVARAWGEWARREDGWFAVINGEILCRCA